MSWAENLPDGSLKNFSYGEIGKKIAREDLGRAVEWVDGMEESEVKTQVGEGVAEAGRENPAEAAEWFVNARRRDPIREHGGSGQPMGPEDPTATAEWLNQFHAGELMDEPIQRFEEVVRKDPEIAMTWAEAIVNEEGARKGRLPKSIGLRNMAKQAEAAESGRPCSRRWARTGRSRSRRPRRTSLWAAR